MLGAGSLALMGSQASYSSSMRGSRSTPHSSNCPEKVIVSGYDSWGDGWNEGSLIFDCKDENSSYIRIFGTHEDFASSRHPSGGLFNFTRSENTSKCESAEVSWQQGLWNHEVSFQAWDENGKLIFTGSGTDGSLNQNRLIWKCGLTTHLPSTAPPPSTPASPPGTPTALPPSYPMASILPANWTVEKVPNSSLIEFSRRDLPVTCYGIENGTIISKQENSANLTHAAKDNNLVVKIDDLALKFDPDLSKFNSTLVIIPDEKIKEGATLESLYQSLTEKNLVFVKTIDNPNAASPVFVINTGRLILDQATNNILPDGSPKAYVSGSVTHITVFGKDGKSFLAFDTGQGSHVIELPWKATAIVQADPLSFGTVESFDGTKAYPLIPKNAQAPALPPRYSPNYPSSYKPPSTSSPSPPDAVYPQSNPPPSTPPTKSVDSLSGQAGLKVVEKVAIAVAVSLAGIFTLACAAKKTLCARQVIPDANVVGVNIDMAANVQARSLGVTTSTAQHV